MEETEVRKYCTISKFVTSCSNRIAFHQGGDRSSKEALPFGLIRYIRTFDVKSDEHLYINFTPKRGLWYYVYCGRDI